MVMAFLLMGHIGVVQHSSILMPLAITADKATCIYLENTCGAWEKLKGRTWIELECPWETNVKKQLHSEAMETNVNLSWKPEHMERNAL